MNEQEKKEITDIVTLATVHAITAHESQCQAKFVARDENYLLQRDYVNSQMQKRADWHRSWVKARGHVFGVLILVVGAWVIKEMWPAIAELFHVKPPTGGL